MSKYIDSNKLIAEIERLLEKAKNDEEKAFVKKDAAGHLAAVTKTTVCVKIKKLITSLQQEQPTKGYDEKYLNEKIAKAKKSWEGVDVDKYMDDVRGRKQQEQPEVELEEELKELVARNAASIWCRCFKCDGIINVTGSKCDKEKLITCLKWYDGYRTALLALGDKRIFNTRKEESNDAR